MVVPYEREADIRPYPFYRTLHNRLFSIEVFDLLSFSQTLQI